MPTSSDSAQVLAEWHDAVNAGDIDAALACCAEDVAVAGPRGVGHGHELMRGWLARSGIRLEPVSTLVEQEGRFVVQEIARWTTPDAPEAAPKEPTPTWCVFTVADGKLTSVARFETEADIPPA